MRRRTGPRSEQGQGQGQGQGSRRAKNKDKSNIQPSVHTRPRATVGSPPPPPPPPRRGAVREAADSEEEEEEDDEDDEDGSVHISDTDDAAAPASRPRTSVSSRPAAAVAAASDSEAEEDEEEHIGDDRGNEDQRDDVDDGDGSDGAVDSEDERLAAEEEAASAAALSAASGGRGAADAEEDESSAVGGVNSSVPRSRSKHALPVLPADDAYSRALEMRGVVYLSRLPPHMKAAKLRWFMERMVPAYKKHGRIGRIYLTPEDASLQRRRKKAGGNAGRRFTQGWVEFESKKVARWVAEAYNAQAMGGSKRSRYHDDLWTLQYLRGFKWHHLTERIAADKLVRDARVREEMAQAKRDSEHYLAQVERKAKSDIIEAKRAKKRERDGVDAADERASKKSASDSASAKPPRAFHQRALLDKRRPAASAAAAEPLAVQRVGKPT